MDAACVALPSGAPPAAEEMVVNAPLGASEALPEIGLPVAGGGSRTAGGGAAAARCAVCCRGVAGAGSCDAAGGAAALAEASARTMLSMMPVAAWGGDVPEKCRGALRLRY